MPDSNSNWKKIEPLLKRRITCGSSKCESGYHSFKRDMRKKENQGKTHRNGVCISCGVKRVDWERIDIATGRSL